MKRSMKMNPSGADQTETMSISLVVDGIDPYLPPLLSIPSYGVRGVYL